MLPMHILPIGGPFLKTSMANISKNIFLLKAFSEIKIKILSNKIIKQQKKQDLTNKNSASYKLKLLPITYFNIILSKPLFIFQLMVTQPL